MVFLLTTQRETGWAGFGQSLCRIKIHFHREPARIFAERPRMGWAIWSDGRSQFTPACLHDKNAELRLMFRLRNDNALAILEEGFYSLAAHRFAYACRHQSALSACVDPGPDAAGADGQTRAGCLTRIQPGLDLPRIQFFAFWIRVNTVGGARDWAATAATQQQAYAATAPTRAIMSAQGGPGFFGSARVVTVNARCGAQLYGGRLSGVELI